MFRSEVAIGGKGSNETRLGNSGKDMIKKYVKMKEREQSLPLQLMKVIVLTESSCN